MRKHQLEWVLERLKENGRVSRNDALAHFISRLSGYILKLRQQGYDFDTLKEGGDYVYVLVSEPKKKGELTLEEQYDLFEPKKR